MIILGIHDGHNASAALTVDGNLVAAMAEERLSRQKHHYGFPALAITAILKQIGISAREIDRIAMSTPTLPPSYFYTCRNARFSIADYWKEQREYWYPKLYENKSPKYLSLFSNHVYEDLFPYNKGFIKDENDHKGMWQARVDYVCKVLNVEKTIISVHDHHTCHAYYGYISATASRNQDVLVYTMDGGGDGTNGTVSVGSPDGTLKFISRSSNCNIGRIYRYATLLLGMRPADHEYKLMGLAAYNTMDHAKAAYDVFAETLQVDGLGFNYKTPVKDHFFHFKERLEGMRFDAIAYAVQKRTEELLCEWIRNGVKETGIRSIIMSGGVAQNIKANKLIWEQDEVDDLFIPPGPGDESISIGAAFSEATKMGVNLRKISPMKNGYFGISYCEDDIKDAIDEYASEGWTIKMMDNDQVATLLAKGDIVARFGRDQMEFGARALGNRSIIADPRSQDVIHHINKLVKMRDFWMPFAPSIIEEREHDYIVNPKHIEAKYMAIGFDSTDLAKLHLTAGLHPFDKSGRPQIVRKQDNPDYHALISAFERITGVGAVLNTSFNIHGEPIVSSPKDALDTFKRSGLHHLILGSQLISKN